MCCRCSLLSSGMFRSICARDRLSEGYQRPLHERYRPCPPSRVPAGGRHRDGRSALTAVTATRAAIGSLSGRARGVIILPGDSPGGGSRGPPPGRRPRLGQDRVNSPSDASRSLASGPGRGRGLAPQGPECSGRPHWQGRPPGGPGALSSASAAAAGLRSSQAASARSRGLGRMMPLARACLTRGSLSVASRCHREAIVEGAGAVDPSRASPHPRDCVSVTVAPEPPAPLVSFQDWHMAGRVVHASVRTCQCTASGSIFGDLSCFL
jgi:hypothetical protein